MDENQKYALNRLPTIFMDNFGLGRKAAIVIMIIIGLVVIFACLWFFYSALPKTMTITCGEKGSLYYGVAEKYAKILRGTV